MRASLAAIVSRWNNLKLRFQRWLCSQMTFQFRTASLPGIAGMRFSYLKCVETRKTTHSHMINPKIVKYSTKSATRTFCGHVALFFAPKRATLQERRGRLLECAHVVRFPEVCVGSE